MKRKAMKPQIARDSRGSAMLIVIIAMLFVIVLGITLLFAAYSGYLVKITERGDTGNFYTASAALDDIRDGLQRQVADAVKVAYTETLASKPDITSEDYATYNAQSVFEQKFYEQVQAIQTGSDSKTQLITQKGTDNSYQYNPSALRAYIKDQNASYTLNDGQSTASAVRSADGKAFTLQGVKVKCVNQKNFESTVSADITVALPAFTVGSRAVTAIGTTVIVASKGLVGSGTSTVSAGDVYVGGSGYGASGTDADKTSTLGGVTVSGGGSLTFDGCTLTCTGDITNNGKLLTFTPGANASAPIWARNIILAGNDSQTTLGGRVNAANDLLLGGKGASVTLSGSYYGFGGGDGKNVPDSSSAIVVNGRDCQLNVSGLETLSLAGVSFINATKDLKENTDGGSIRTGQSVAAKPDQLAYLVPASCLKNYTTNPCVVKTDKKPGDVDTTKPLWGTDKTLASYSNYTVKSVYTQNGLAYVFLSFSDQSSANAYYADYFKYGSYNGVSVSSYLSQYLTLTGSAGTYSTAGSAYKADAYGTVALVPASMAASTGSEWDSIISGRYYDQYVNRSNMSALPTDSNGQPPVYTFVDTDGEKAVVTNGDYTYDGDSSIHLIVAAGNVTITKNFTGTIICDGTVTLTTGNVKAQRYDNLAEATCAALTDKTQENADKLTTYVKAFTAGQQAEANAWSLDKLVYYANWKKY